MVLFPKFYANVVSFAFIDVDLQEPFSEIQMRHHIFGLFLTVAMFVSLIVLVLVFFDYCYLYFYVNFISRESSQTSGATPPT